MVKYPGYFFHSTVSPSSFYMSHLHDSRLLTLNDWLGRVLPHPIEHFAPASSDASFRRYFRVTYAGCTAIVMDAPPERENVAAFLRMGALLREAGIHVPDVYEADTAQGFLLLSDLGSTPYQAISHTSEVPALYQAAIATLQRMQTSIPATSAQGIPVYDDALLRRELHIFREWFVEGLLGLSLTPDEAVLWDETCDRLVASALEQPQVFVHRDYHSRNLMVTADNNPGVLDFQDAVWGPVTYDLVSLLRDCYIEWPDAQVDAWVESFCEAGLPGTGQPSRFRRWFDLMGCQRHLKAIGIFSRLKLRDGKSGYLADIPRTLNYVSKVTRQYPELSKLGRFLDGKVYPDLSWSLS